MGTVGYLHLTHLPRTINVIYIIPSIQLFVRCDSVYNTTKHMQHIDISGALKRQMWNIQFTL